MDEFIKLLTALGPFISAVGTTTGVLVVVFRKGKKERVNAAREAAQQTAATLSPADVQQNVVLQQILDRLEERQRQRDDEDALGEVLRLAKPDAGPPKDVGK